MRIQARLTGPAAFQEGEVVLFGRIAGDVQVLVLFGRWPGGRWFGLGLLLLGLFLFGLLNLGFFRLRRGFTQEGFHDFRFLFGFCGRFFRFLRRHRRDHGLTEGRAFLQLLPESGQLVVQLSGAAFFGFQSRCVRSEAGGRKRRGQNAQSRQQQPEQKQEQKQGQQPGQAAASARGRRRRGDGHWRGGRYGPQAGKILGLGAHGSGRETPVDQDRFAAHGPEIIFCRVLQGQLQQLA